MNTHPKKQHYQKKIHRLRYHFFIQAMAVLVVLISWILLGAIVDEPLAQIAQAQVDVSVSATVLPHIELLTAKEQVFTMEKSVSSASFQSIKVPVWMILSMLIILIGIFFMGSLLSYNKAKKVLAIFHEVSEDDFIIKVHI